MERERKRERKRERESARFAPSHFTHTNLSIVGLDQLVGQQLLAAASPGHRGHGDAVLERLAQQVDGGEQRLGGRLIRGWRW